MADIENFVKIEPNKWKCLYCNNCHMSKTNVKRHIETVHLRSKIYSCSFCPKKFGQKVEVKKHMQRIHESEKLFAIHKLYDKKKEVNESEIVCPSCKISQFHKIGNGIFRYNNGISDLEQSRDRIARGQIALEQSHSTKDSNEESSTSGLKLKFKIKKSS